MRMTETGRERESERERAIKTSRNCGSHYGSRKQSLRLQKREIVMSLKRMESVVKREGKRNREEEKRERESERERERKRKGERERERERECE